MAEADGEPAGREDSAGRTPITANELALAAALSALGVWVLYRKATALFFSHDDLSQLRYVLTHSPFAYCLRPEVWQELPNKLFTPLLMLSLDFDAALFGQDPAGFYAHQLVSLALLTVAFYAALRIWVSRPAAMFGSVAFVLGAPTGSLALLLMTRHYIEAALLLILATITFVYSVRGSSWRWAIVSAALYFLAVLAKEIAAPLAVFLALLPVGDLRTRIRLLRPHVAAAVVYFFYRWAMLGALFGGYGWAVTRHDVPELLVTLPGKLLREFLGVPKSANWVFLAASLAALAFLCRRRRRASLCGLVAALLVLPILPVSTEMAPRYAALPWLCMAVAFALAYQELETRGRRTRLLACAAGAIAVTGVLANRGTWAENLAEMERLSVEARFFLEMRPGELLRKPHGPISALVELRRWREERFGLPKGAGFFSDDLFLCGAPGAPDPPRGFPSRLWTYDNASRRIADITADLPGICNVFKSSLRPEAELTASFEANEGALYWSLGPYSEGRYAFILEGGVAAHEVPREAGFLLKAPALTLCVRYDSPEGWVTYSPELRVLLANGERQTWGRPRHSCF